MAELLLELYSEEIPPQLQIGARTQLKEFIESSFKDNEIKYKELLVFSSPTRLVLLANDIAENIKVAAKEIKGPKIGSPDQVIQGFVKAKKALRVNTEVTRRDGLSSWRVMLFVAAGMLSGKSAAKSVDIFG